jgi:lysozyme-like protein
MALTRDQVATLLLQAAQQMGVNLTRDELTGLTAIAGRESGYNPDAHNPDRATGDDSYGLWQINMLGNMGVQRARDLGITNYSQLYDPLTNARAAIQLVLSGRNQGDPLHAWGGYKGMSNTYNTDMGAASDAVDRVLGGQTAPMAGEDIGGAPAPPAAPAPVVNPASLSPYTQNAQPGWGPPSPDATGPGTVWLSQDQYTADRAGAMNFVKDWITLGGRGVIGGDGKPASYWDVYHDMAANGVDVSGLPTPESMPQGTIKGGGAGSPLRDAPPSAQQMSDQASMTTLLQRLGIDYPNAPQASPGLLAYLRGVGLSMSTAEDTRNAAVNRIQAQTPLQLANVQRAAEQEKRNITGNLQQRNVLASGEATTRYANQAAQVGQRLSDINRAAAQGVSTAATGYSTSVDALRQQALQRLLDTEQQQATAKAQSAAEAQSYQAQADAQQKAWEQQMAAQQDYYNKLAQGYSQAASQPAPPIPEGVSP